MMLPVRTPSLALLGLSATVLLSACGGGIDSVTARAQVNAPIPWEQPVPKAQCRAGDPVETDLQGRVPLVDQVSGRSTTTGYACNLERVGHSPGDGAGWQLAWSEDCAYYGTGTGLAPEEGSVKPGQTNPGVVVMDVSDPTAPQISGYLDTPGMIDPWESLKVAKSRRLLGAINARGGNGGPELDLYDLSGDCSKPELLYSGAPEGTTQVGHAGGFSMDGTIYYGSSLPQIHAYDISDPTAPWLISQDLPVGAHDLTSNAAGDRLYLANLYGNGLAILDSTEVNNRQVDPLVSVISELYWGNYTAQHTWPIKIAGHAYLLFVDEGVSGLSKHERCSNGQPPFAHARIIDIADEANPHTVSNLMLEVHDPQYCAETVLDDPSIFGYDSHYCTPDNPDNTRMIACSQFQSGLRIFDVRDPYKPREIAYYNPAANPGYHPGSWYNLSGVGALMDWATAHPRWVLEREEIWFTSQQNGFQVVRFTQPINDLLGLPD